MLKYGPDVEAGRRGEHAGAVGRHGADLGQEAGARLMPQQSLFSVLM